MSGTTGWPWHSDKLANGLVVGIEEAPLAGMVTVHVRYGVGSKDEAPGTRGSAHLVEHLTCRSGRSFGDHDLPARVRSFGGVSAASTWLDRTTYETTVPPERLEDVLRLEADRMADLEIRDDVLQAETRVLDVERRSAAAEPYGLWDEELQKLAFPKDHPYHHSIHGTPRDVAHSTKAVARAFHHRHYQPANAIITVAGATTHREAFASVSAAFRDLSRSEPGKRPAIPAGQGGGTRVLQASAGTAARVFLAYAAPPEGSTEYAALDLFGDVLATGAASRLNQAIQEGAPFTDYGFELLPLRDAPLVVVWVTAAPKADEGRVRDSLISFVEGASLPSADEVVRAQALDRVRLAEALESSAERAERAASALELGQSADTLLQQDPGGARALPAALAVFSPERRMTLEYRHGEVTA